MKNMLLALAIVGAIGLGCGYELTKREPAQEQPTKETTSSTEEEKRELEKKIADLEKEKLEEKIERLEEEVEEQKKKPAPAPPKKKKTPRPTELEMGYMRVNSPGDGWLALRSGPSSQSRLLVKIPHRSVVRVDYCGSVVRSGKLRGRWCEVVYKGRKGWSFDYYLRR